MDNRFRKFCEIADLTSLLPPEVGEKFIEEALRIGKQHETQEQILRNLNRILRQVRDILPNYDVLTPEDFGLEEEIDATTVGITVFNFNNGEALSIPAGTRIFKEEGLRQLLSVHIKFSNGMLLVLRVENFPKYGIRVQLNKERSE